MENKLINRLLVVCTLLAFLGGVFITGAYMEVNGYAAPWSNPKPVQASTVAEEIDTGTATGLFGENTIREIVKKAGPAVVKIETTVEVAGNSTNPFLNDPFFREFFGDDFQYSPRSQITQGMGSGFIFSKDGYILTNNHVVSDAKEIKVYLSSRQEPYTAKMIGSDAELDLAVIKIEAGNDLPMLKFGNSDNVSAGSWVVAIGNPYGLDHTVTVGVISATGRPVTIEGQEYKNLIQTDASINPGNSGGPLLNLNGEVVGINTAVNASAQGIGFAIPSSTVEQILDQLLTEGKVIRPWLGVIIQPVTDELAQYFGLEKAEGALISNVQSGSPAEKAGLRRGDIILQYNDKPIKTTEELQEAVRETEIGQKVVLLVHRSGGTVYVSVTIDER